MTLPAPVTFSVANAKVSHQVTLELDTGHTHSRTIRAIVDGVSFDLDDCHARPDGKAMRGGGITILIAQTTLTLVHTGHVTFSGIITDMDSRRIVAFILACRLPAI
jgi:hypothetical protein